MWTRDELKFRAKTVLKKSYWMSFVICLILGAAAGIGGGIGSGSSSGARTDALFFDFDASIALLLLGIILFGSLIAIGVSIFFLQPLTVGGRKFFIQATKDDVKLNYIGHAFSSNYLNIVKTVFFKNLFIFLWSLLFLIPGIIKSYQYYFVEYLMAERPDMDYRRALDLSRQMTDGHKWNIFVLELSFIGWYLLGILACCIGGLFVNPYYFATQTQLYLTLRYNAIQNGITSESELGTITNSYENSTQNTSNSSYSSSPTGYSASSDDSRSYELGSNEPPSSENVNSQDTPSDDNEDLNEDR